MRGLLIVIAVLLATWLWGPLVPLLLALAWLVCVLGGRRVPLLQRADAGLRRALWPQRPLRTLGLTVAGLLVAVGVVVVIPDGWLGIPPGAGVLVGPDFRGRPMSPDPVTGVTIAQNPHLAPNGRNSMHNDAWASDVYAGPGPLGREVDVDTAWYGLQECATLAFDRDDRLIAMCGDLKGPTLHVIDPDTMRKQATLRLPDRPKSDEGKKPWENLCAGAYFYLDDADRAVVATTDRRVVTVDTRDGAGDPDLAIGRSYSLRAEIPREDCLIALLPDWSGRIWWLTQDGLVGTLDPASGQAAAYDLKAPIDNSFATGADGGVYVVSTQALYRFDADPSGAPQVSWRAPYDRGSGVKPGQLGQGSGTTPTVLDEGRLVAITDNAEPRMNVLAYDTTTGEETCRVPVFSDGASATENSLVGFGTSVIVENNYGYSGPLATMLGRTTERGVARVDLDTCRVRWTADVAAPTSVPKASLATGLLYVYAKQPSWTGVAEWYFTALDLRTGHLAFAVRTGTGTLFNNHYAAVTLAPDGSAFIATLAGLVRVRDGAPPPEPQG